MICLYNLIPKSAKSVHPLADHQNLFIPAQPQTTERLPFRRNDIDKSDLKTLKNRVEINSS
jgi:hypothetical protein